MATQNLGNTGEPPLPLETSTAKHSHPSQAGFLSGEGSTNTVHTFDLSVELLQLLQPRLQSVCSAVRKIRALPWSAFGLATETSYPGSRSWPGDMAKQVITCKVANSRNFSFL